MSATGEVNHIPYQQPFQLSVMDKQSPTWTKLSEHLKDRIDTLRKQNDGTRLTETETAVIRGQILILKSLIGLEEELPQADS